MLDNRGNFDSAAIVIDHHDSCFVSKLDLTGLLIQATMREKVLLGMLEK